MVQKKFSLLLIVSLSGLMSLACGDDSGDTGSAAGEGDGEVVALGGGSESADPGATETNAAPIMCSSEIACPDGIPCVMNDPNSDVGFCDSSEMDAIPVEGLPVNDADVPVSSAAPAPCASDAECPEGVDCVFPSGETELGFCDVDDIVEPGDEGATAPGVMEL